MLTSMVDVVNEKVSENIILTKEAIKDEMMNLGHEGLISVTYHRK